MLWKWLLTFSSFAAAAFAVPSDHVVHEKRDDSASSRWVRRERVRPHAILPVRIGLKQNEANLDRAHDYLMDISHPSSINYGKHWTPEEVIDAFKPTDETVESVRQWLIDSGVDSKIITHSDNKGWLAFHAPVEQVESLLHTTYHEYEDRRTGGVMPSCDQYHVPASIQQHIDYISPGIKLMAPSDNAVHEGSKMLQRREGTHGNSKSKLRWRPDWAPHHGPPSQDLSNCDREITPACIDALYQIPPASRHTDPSNSMGIFEAELQYWDQLDLDLFFSNYTNIPNGTHPIDYNIDGGVAQTKNVSQAGGEATLDIQQAYAIIYPQSVTDYNVDDLNYQTWANDTYTWGFNTLLDAIDGSYCTFSAYGETGK